MKTHANFKKHIFDYVFWFKYTLPIKFKIRILDLMLLLKNSVPFEGLYYSKNTFNPVSYLTPTNIKCTQSTLVHIIQTKSR